MRSELFRIPFQWGPIPIFGFGVLLVAWLLFGGWRLFDSIRARGWSTETRDLCWGLVLVAAVILCLPFLPQWFPRGFSLLAEGIPVRGYGVMLLLAATAGVGLSCVRANQMGLGSEVIFSLAVWLFVSGIIGARLFFVVEYWDTDFRGDNLVTTIAKVLNFPQGGLVVYGALMGTLIAFVGFVFRHRLPLLALADIVAPSFLVGLAIGRIGCLLNGCCYGGICDQPWAVTFPQESPPYQDQVARGERHEFRIAPDRQARAVVVTGNDRLGLARGEVIVGINGQPCPTYAEATKAIHNAYWGNMPLDVEIASGKEVQAEAVPVSPRSLPVHPTQIYSTINAALIAWLLWSFFPFRSRDGEVVALMLLVYPISRFLLEMIRTDEINFFGTGMSISQNVSVVLIVAALIGWGVLRTQPARLTLPAP
jgi:phosphatidylglycerol:prolipoprotein diacylglycerol transferase